MGIGGNEETRATPPRFSRCEKIERVGGAAGSISRAFVCRLDNRKELDIDGPLTEYEVEFERRVEWSVCRPLVS